MGVTKATAIASCIARGSIAIPGGKSPIGLLEKTRARLRQLKVVGTVRQSQMSERSLQTYILPAEQAAILDRCFHPSGSFVEFPAVDVEASIPARFEAMARLYGDRPALIAGARRVSYAELNRAANRLARAILTKCGPGSAPVALLFASAVSSIVAILAVLKAGKAYVPLDASYPQARLAAMLTDSQAQLVVSEKSLFPLLQAADSIRRPVLDIDAIDADLSDEDLGIAFAPSDYACIMYTSGSTGEPKGVIQNHRNILHKVLTHTNDYRICVEDRLSLLYSYAFSASVRCIFGALLNGAALVLLDIKREAMTRVAERIVEERVTLYFSVPTLFRELAAALEGLRKPSSVRLIYLGGEAVSKADIDLYKRSFPSDCIVAHSMSAGETGTTRQCFISKATEIGDLVPVGYGVRDKQVVLLDEQRQRVGFDRPGEIAVKSHFLSPGYWHRPDLTDAKFLPDPEDRQARIYLTGDLGVMRPDGCLEYLGRKDFQLKVRGHGFGAGVVEAALHTISSIKEAVVASRENASGEACLVAYIVPGGQPAPTVTTLRRALADRLPSPMIPSAFVFLDALPMTANGKIDRRELPEPGNARPALDAAYVAPRTTMEREIAAIWAELLCLETVGIDDNFLDLGGHSLAAARVITRVMEAFHTELPLTALFDGPTVAQMAALIVRQKASSAGAPELERMLNEVEAITDDEARESLAQAQKAKDGARES